MTIRIDIDRAANSIYPTTCSLVYADGLIDGQTDALGLFSLISISKFLYVPRVYEFY